MSTVAFRSPFNRGEYERSEETTAGQKSSRRVYLCDKSLPFVRRKCLGFRRHLRAVYPARTSCASLARDSRESTVDNTLFPAEKRAKPAKPTQGMALVSDKVKYRSDAGPSFPRAFPLLTLASNYNVTSRRRRLGCRRGRCGPAIYRGRHIAEIFSRRIWLSGQDGGG